MGLLDHAPHDVRRGRPTPPPAGPATGAVAVVLAGGADDASPDDVPASPDLVVAADSGLHLARRLGLVVDVVVGDLDSVDPDALADARAAGVAVEVHPTDKDTSDLELALEAVAARGATHVVVVGLHGGRLDHHLANLLLLASPRFRHLRVEAVGRAGRVVVVHDHATLAAPAGAVVTLLPVGGPATGVRTQGLRWPLRGETLEPGTTRGLSNEVVDPPAGVSVETGTLLAVIPGGPA